jgi:branched-chain amino acid transport system permease protein
MIDEIIQSIIGGLLLGGIYGLAAFGLSLTFGVLNILNLAHGEFLIVGGFLGVWACSSLGLNPFVAAIVTVPFFTVIALALHGALIRPLGDPTTRISLESSLVVTLGLSLLISDLLSFMTEFPVAGIPYSAPPIEIGGVIVSPIRAAVLVFTLIAAVCVGTFLKRTDTGRSIRAIVDCREGALMVGVHVRRLAALTFAFGSSLAATAGTLFATLFNVTPVMGPQLTVKCLCVVVLGGLGSVTGSLLGGIALGTTETLTALWIGPEWAPLPAFLLLIVFLSLRPTGIMSGRS